MPTHWYACKRIRHRMGTRVERLKDIDAANLKFIAFLNDKDPYHSQGPVDWGASNWGGVPDLDVFLLFCPLLSFLGPFWSFSRIFLTSSVPIGPFPWHSRNTYKTYPTGSATQSGPEDSLESPWFGNS